MRPRHALALVTHTIPHFIRAAVRAPVPRPHLPARALTVTPVPDIRQRTQNTTGTRQMRRRYTITRQSKRIDLLIRPAGYGLARKAGPYVGRVGTGATSLSGVPSLTGRTGDATVTVPDQPRRTLALS